MRLKQGVFLDLTLFPSTCHPAVVERYYVSNESDRSCRILVEGDHYDETTPAGEGVYGSYHLRACLEGLKEFEVHPQNELGFSRFIVGTKLAETLPPWSGAIEEKARRDFVVTVTEELSLETPNPEINAMFGFAKIRASESIFETKGGLFHSPGGGLLDHGGGFAGKGKYYAACWTNDQGEYLGPLFPFLGYRTAIDASQNMYRHFSRFINEDDKPIPSSIIAEGTDNWNGAGDRGDCAMVATGAARFALALGDQDVARKLWPLIAWCIDYCHRRLTPEGVVASDTDELENRLPSGKANLHTSCLTYDLLQSAASLADELGFDAAVGKVYLEQAARLRAAIESHFGTILEGFSTYRYYEGNDVLRAWICSPLAFGIFDRKEGTIAALLSPRLWGPDGLTTASGRKDFWDRATLYALRGIFYAGEADQALGCLEVYTYKRLLGEHIPYAVEASSEGDQGHLAAESALYARVIVEGLFGLRPKGLRVLECRPALPTTWPRMALRRVHGFGEIFDLIVERGSGDSLLTVVRQGKPPRVYQVPPNSNVEVRFDN
jgi:hypothetical protein